MAMVYPRQYKIDEASDHWWKYSAYRRHRILGFDFWSCIRKADDLPSLRAAIEIDMTLPIFINETPTADRRAS